MEQSTDRASTGAQLELLPIHISSNRRTNTSATRHLDLHEQRLNHQENMSVNPQVRQKDRGGGGGGGGGGGWCYLASSLRVS